MWTYDPSQLGTSKLFQVRRLIGDVDTADQQLQDEEINYALSIRASVFGAAAECARMIASQLSRFVDMKAGGTEIKSSQDQRAYLQMAAMFDGKAALAGSGVPFAGGISRTQKQSNEQNEDRVTPSFVIGGDDDLLPVAPVDPSPRT